MADPTPSVKALSFGPGPMSQAQASNEHDESGVDGREPVGVWVLEHASDARFPFRLRIFTRDRAEPMLSFFVQDRWPGSNQHIFCLRESRMAEDVVVDGELERVPVVALRDMAGDSAWSWPARARSGATSRSSTRRTSTPSPAARRP